MSKETSMPVKGIAAGGIIGAAIGAFIGSLIGEGGSRQLAEGLTGFHYGLVAGAVLGAVVGFLLARHAGPKGFARHHGEPKKVPGPKGG
jgi:outer membrane lipoprotein SlyB